MNTATQPHLHAWTTSSFGDAADTSPMELSALGEHLSQCQSLSGRLFDLRCRAASLHSFVAARFVTTVVVLLATGLTGAALLVL